MARTAALKRGARFKFAIARLDFLAGERAEAVHPELLAAEAAHDGAVDDGPLELGEVELAVLRRDAASGEVADEAAGEAIARAGRVEDLFEEVAGGHEMAVAAEEN